MGSFKTAISSALVILFSCYTICVLSLEPAKCKGQDIKISDADMNVFKDCVKVVGGSDTIKDVPKEKMPCVGKCILMKRGLVNQDGMPVKDNIITMINATMPAEIVPDLDKAMGKCIDDFGKVDAKDETCSSYQPLCECIMKSFLMLCTEDKKEKKAA